MEESTKKFLSYLKVLGIKIDVQSFDSRFKAQKLAYILQVIIEDNKQLYPFGFHLKGPYSHGLAVEYFANKDLFADPSRVDSPNQATVAKLERLKPLLTKLASTPRDLEVVGSLLFLIVTRGMTEQVAEVELRKRKPHLSQEEIWRGTNTLKMLTLTEEEKTQLSAELNSEMGEWKSVVGAGAEHFN